MTCIFCSKKFILLLLSVVSAVILGIALQSLYYTSTDDDNQIDYTKSGYFGPGKPRPDDARVLPFQVNFSQPAIAELKQRLRSARIGHQALEDVPDWSYGVRPDSLEEWRDYWANKFDFDKAQAELNQFPQFVTELEGIKLHFLHVKPPRPAAYRRVVPLLLAHGWPGGVYEFFQIIPLLADPKAHSLDSELAFELIVPSIPGYGFSEQPHKQGFDGAATARIFHRLVTERLGHSKYMAQGGDWGSLIVSNLGKLYPSHVQGIHLNMAFVPFFDSLRSLVTALIGCYRPAWVFSDPEHFQNYSLTATVKELLQESGYMHIQMTKPDTVGVGLNDSPLGLLAYILEKFSTWTNPAYKILPDGGVLKRFTRDQVLTLISVYWFQGNIVSSQRFYKENAAVLANKDELAKKFVSVPTGYAAFAHDLGGPQPRELVQLSFNLTHMTIFPDGGHFAAFEQPKLLAKDFLKFANGL